MKRQYLTYSLRQTQKIAKELAKKVIKNLPLNKKAVVIGLIGDLGAGKTTFIQGFANGLGIKEKILSPTFIIMRKFEIRNSKFETFYHIDCYRIENSKEILDLGFKEIISDPKNIIIIEWADRIKKIMPRNTIWINFDFIDTKTRKIVIQ